MFQEGRAGGQLREAESPAPSKARMLVGIRSAIKNGGARRDRTDDLMLAKHALSQLSYGPNPGITTRPNRPRHHLAQDEESGGPGKI